MEEKQVRKPKRGKVSQADQALLAQRATKALYWKTRGRTMQTIMEMSQRQDWDPWPYQSIQSVYEDIQRGLRDAKKAREAMAGELIEEELQKLDRMEEAGWIVLESLHYVVNQGEVVYIYADEQPERIKQGWARPKLRDEETETALREKAKELAREPLVDNKPVLDALTVLLKIAERRSKLLGLDAPVKKQIDVNASSDVDRKIDDLLGRRQRRMEELGAAGQGEALPNPAA